MTNTSNNQTENKEIKPVPGSVMMHMLLPDFLDEIQEMADTAPTVSGIPTGFVDFDLLTSGIHPGQLIILASRPSIGKSSLAINIAEHVGLNVGVPVVIHSLGLSAKQVCMRMVASVCRIDGSHLKNGRLSDDEWLRLPLGIEEFGGTTIVVDDTPHVLFSDLKEKLILHKENFGAIGLVVIDGLELMAGDTNQNVIDLKKLAKELSFPIILTTQVGDDLEFRANKRPTMFDIRNIPSIERFADIIAFIYRDEVYTKDACREPGVAELNIAKHNNGPVGIIKFAFMGRITKFESLANSDSPSGQQ
jgi:replicative DNA helicase